MHSAGCSMMLEIKNLQCTGRSRALGKVGTWNTEGGPEMKMFQNI